MSVDQLPPGKARSGKPAAQIVRYDEYIDKQIESTRRTVKAVDLLTALLTMAVGTLAFLFVAAAIEHWLVPGGFNLATRLVLFVALVLSLTFYTTRKLWPLLRGSINPAYAAQAIEHENPSLKNSLLNLLLFRQHRDDVTDAVYETLEAEAAHRLTRVPVDTAVDRTQLLRLGYALIVILAIVALYKILSPKDPFASAERLLMPWARIAAPSRVTIDNIEPGHVTLARGETLQVAADVRGIGADDPVVVRFTTADGQAVDHPAPMKPNSAGLRFTGQIPPESDTSLGVAQDLRYHIEAGDARSLEYKVTVVAAPTIVVERIDYDYPAYTGYEDRGFDRLGDIRAIEGTRVTIRARANQPIDEAAVDFEADGRRDVSLKVDGDRGQASFTLELRDDRQTSRFTSYALRFTGRDGRPNRDPVKFRIDVLADYPPEAAILAPADKTRDVKLDETVTIEVEARDPDFALGEVRLQGESAGRSVMSERLLSREHSGRYTGQLRFTPNEHGLHAGDVVRYWVTVRDNRTPRANETTTDSQTLRIVGPDPRQPPQDRIAQRDERVQRDQRQSQDNDQSQEQQGEGQSGQSEGQSQDDQSSETSQGSEQGESASADGEPGQDDEQGDANQSNENGTGERSQDQSNDAQSGGESSGDGQSSAGEQSGESQQQPGGSEQSGDGERPGKQQGSSAGSQSDSGSELDGENQQSENGSREQDSGSAHGGEDAAARDADDSTPVSSEGDNDADAFERIRKFLKREGQLPEDSNSDNGQSSEQKSQPGESASADGEQSSTKNSIDQSSQGDQNIKNPPSDSTDTNTDPTADATSDQRKSDAQDFDNQRDSRDPSDQGQEGQQQPEGGQPTQGQGDSGAGNQAEQGQGAPGSQQPQPTDQWQQRPSGEKQDDRQDPASGGHGKRESDSQGDQGGDHAGSGEQGGGQQSNHDGTGSSGQNQSADEGAGESSEQGKGNNSMSGGQDAQANEPTGESSENQAGEGSQQREGTGDQPGGSQGGQQQIDQGKSQRGGEEQQSQGDPNEKQEVGHGDEHGRQSNGTGDEQSDVQRGGEDAPAGDSESQQSHGSPNSGPNAADGAGKVPDGTMQQPSGATGEAPEGDAANLEYARKQTDLVLETLAEQMKRQKVDRRLLDELGWTEADMKRFVERWQQLKAAAGENGPDANENQRELDDALRSLGLRPGQLQQSKVTDDQNRNLRQGYRGAIPLEYKERLKAYEQGVSRAR